MKSLQRIFSSLVLATFLLTTTFLATGCSPKDDNISIDPEYSWNLTKIGEDWPRMKMGKPDLKDSEQEVYDQHGRPDSVRILYDRQRTVFTKMEVDTKFKGRNAKTLDDFEHSWIYYMRDMEIVFHPSGTYEVLPLTDKIKTLYLYGDPNARTNHPTRTDEETWTYYQDGKRFKFSGDDLIDEENFTRMGRFKRL